MQKLDSLIEKYYNKFVGLPIQNPIVRQNQQNDAFELVVLETLYGKEKEVDIEKMNASDINTLIKYIVAPPDDGIDIVIEHEGLDENYYEFVQVKNSALTQSEIKQAMSYMEKTIETYFKKPQDVCDNLKKVLSETSLTAGDKQNCKYILVHRGNDNYFKGQKNNAEQVITGTELETIRNCSNQQIPKVAEESFLADCFNNFNIYEEAQNEPAIVLNLRGYDLAELAIKYTNTSLGRNILFGQNLRESLAKSKTFEGMAKTIREEPEKFWFYNNGITIIAEDYNTVNSLTSDGSVEKFILKNFSIINGAQTTSALGRFLKEARMNSNQEDIELLKQVYVLVRILKVNNPEFRSRIAIFNNTQNPITTRDMASNREEQLQLHKGFLSGEKPHIYMEIRRGMTPPNDVKLYKHQLTSNEELAQLSFAGFRKDPFLAKDKKNSIFNTDYQKSEYLLNEYYHAIFHSDGYLFKKNKKDIDELLFINYLYKESKKSLIATYKKRIAETQNLLDSASDQKERADLEKKINEYEKLKAIANICAFYCICYYYTFKTEFPSVDVNKNFNYERFYSEKDYKEKVVQAFNKLFLTGTIKIIKDLIINSPNLNTWIRDKKSTQLFNDKLNNDLQINIELEDRYKEFVETTKE